LNPPSWHNQKGKDLLPIANIFSSYTILFLG